MDYVCLPEFAVELRAENISGREMALVITKLQEANSNAVRGAELVHAVTRHG